MRIKVLIALMAALAATSSSCCAKSHADQRPLQPVAAVDTIMQKAVGDSIYRIITNAKKITVASLPSATDSVKAEVTEKIGAKHFDVVNFIVANPKNYLRNSIKYGEFVPQFAVTYTRKQEVVTLKYDFGLRKWGLFDADNREIGMYDLASDNMLRFACMQFPDNQFFNELLLTRETNAK